VYLKGVTNEKYLRIFNFITKDLRHSCNREVCEDFKFTMEMGQQLPLGREEWISVFQAYLFT